MKILIVDDKKEERYLAETLLKGSGYEVETATNGVEALEKLHAEGFDMIVSDVLMPVMDGFKFCRECQGDEKLKDIPFVFYTATYKDERDEDLALKLGADKFLIKPMEPEEFIQIIQGVFRDVEEGKIGPKRYVLEGEEEVFKLYSERLITKLEKKMLELEVETAERKQAQEELQVTEQNFRNSLDDSPLGIRIVTAEGELLYVNQAILDIYGYSSVEELKAMPIKKRYTPESYAKFQERKEKRKLGKPVPASYEISIVRKDGEVRHLTVSRKVVVWGGEAQVQSIYQDITERKKAEEALKASEAKYQDLYENAPDMHISIDPNTTIILGCNQTAATNLGYTKREIVGRPIYDMYHPDCMDDVKRAIQSFVETGEVRNAELQLKRKDGTKIDVSLNGSAVRDDQGNILYSRSAWRDITERKQTEEKVKRAAEEWRTTFDSITDSISIHDKDFRLVRVNKACADLLKKKPAELIGKHCYEVFHGTSEPMPNCPHEKTIKTKKPAMAEYFEPHLGIHLEVATSPIFDEKGEVTASVHVARDITERKKMEEQLIITDRLASIGELASGIAHELNNPLTSVIGFSDLLLDRGVPDDIKEDLSIINKEAKRTAEVVKGLLTFARKHPEEKELTNINGIIEEVLELRAYEQRVNNIEVNTQFASDLPEVMANSFELQQVFINIVINAEHFMIEAHGRGNLTITTERIGDVIRASFADDGPGIAKENLGHLFDPFFTTKEVGKGTGLGLSICHGIVTAHDGKIYAESRPGKGATFVVELPLTTSDKGGTKNENS